MKFAIKPEDKLALVIALLPHPIQGAERQDIRLTAWDDLGVRKFARLASLRMQKQGDRVTFTAEEMEGLTGDVPVVVDLSPVTVQFLIDEIIAGVPGLFVDQLAELRGELRRLQDKTYELPRELRALEAVG